MSKSFTFSDGLSRKGYHHGNLREALIEAARFLVTEKGPQGFTLIEAARLADVSPAAPYRHFKDREALVAEVSRLGAQAFERRMRAAAEGAPSPAARLMALGQAYLAFAREDPGLYRALFDTNCGPERPRAVLDMLVGTIAAARPDHPDVLGAATGIWALAHGVALLSVSGNWPASGPSPERVLNEGARALVRATAPF